MEQRSRIVDRGGNSTATFNSTPGWGQPGKLGASHIKPGMGVWAGTGTSIAAFNGNSFTIECWYSGTPATIADMILGTQSGVLSTNLFFYVLQSGQVIFQTSAGHFTSNTLVHDQAWHHIAVTYSATTNTLRLYIDGNLDNDLTAAQSIVCDDLELCLFNFANIHHMSSEVDELRIWMSERTATEIKQSQITQLPVSGLFYAYDAPIVAASPLDLPATDVPLGGLAFNTFAVAASSQTITALTLDYVGTAPATSLSNLELWEDTDGDGLFDSVNDTLLAALRGTMAAGKWHAVTLDLSQAVLGAAQVYTSDVIVRFQMEAVNSFALDNVSLGAPAQGSISHNGATITNGGTVNAGDIATGGEHPVTFVVHNASEADLIISGVTFANASGVFGFAELDSTLPLFVPSGTSADLILLLSGFIHGSFAFDVEVAWNDVASSTVEFEVTATSVNLAPIVVIPNGSAFTGNLSSGFVLTVPYLAKLENAVLRVLDPNGDPVTVTVKGGVAGVAGPEDQTITAAARGFLHSVGRAWGSGDEFEIRLNDGTVTRNVKVRIEVTGVPATGGRASAKAGSANGLALLLLLAAFGVAWRRRHAGCATA